MSSENRDIRDILKENAVDNQISCPRAFAISAQTGIFPDLIGIAMNESGLKITGCQMGLFGCQSGNKIIVPAAKVSPELEEMIFNHLSEDGKLECKAAWHIASELKIGKFDVACACEKLEFKIFKCQLGAF